VTSRVRLTATFTAITAVILAGVLVLIYVLTAQSTRHDFYGRLRERTTSVATVFLEHDTLSRAKLLDFNQRYHEDLTDESAAVLRDNGRKQVVDQHGALNTSEELQAEARQHGVIQRQYGERQLVAEYYHDAGGNFIVVVSAVDRAGNEKLSTLLLLMAGGYSMGLVVLALAGSWFAKGAMQPWEQSIARERLFLANASHELRTPLTTMIGELQVRLSRERTDEEYRETLRSVLMDAERLNDIVNGMLMLSQANAKPDSIQREPVRMDDILFDVLAMMQRHHEARRMRVEFDVPNDAHSVTVMAHPMMMRVVITNIIDNALKYSGNEIVEITLQSDSHTVRLIVRDKGLGIAPEDLMRLTEPFFRAASVRPIRGYGIGIPLADRLITLFGGELQISSVEGSGTTATIIVPVYDR